MPVGLAGLATSTPASGASRCASSTCSAVSAQRVSGADRDLHRDEAERLQDVAVGGIGGRGHGDAVARVEGAEEDQVEAAGGAGRHHHARRRELDAVGLAIVARDPLAERPDAERLGIAEAALQGLGRGAEHRRRRRRAGLSDLHVDDAAGRPPPVRPPRRARPWRGTARPGSVAEAFNMRPST